MSDLTTFLLHMNDVVRKLADGAFDGFPKVDYDKIGLEAIERYINQKYEPSPFIFPGLFAVYGHFFGQTITNTVPGAIWVDCAPDNRPHDLCIRIPLPSGGEHTKGLLFPWNAIREYWPTRRPTLVGILNAFQQMADPNFDLKGFYAGRKMEIDGSGIQAEDMDFILNEEREAFFKHIKDFL